MDSATLTGVAAEMATAAIVFLDRLSPDQCREALFDVGAPERHDWHYFPRDGRPGVHLRGLDAHQRTLALDLVASVHSPAGMWKTVQIMELESEVRAMEGEEQYHPLNYALAVFGDPRRGPPWGWRLEGHHLSLTVIAVDSTVTVTPAFMGANPHVVHDGAKHGLAVLEEESDKAFELLHALEPDQRAAALLSDEAPSDIFTQPGAEQRLHAPRGLAAADLDGRRREALMDLVAAYVRRLRPELADLEMRRLNEAGPERLHFAWAGSQQPGSGHYYRLHGPSLVIEFDNTQNDANHVHTVWHDPTGRDFGDDPLARHHRHGHRQGSKGGWH